MPRSLSAWKHIRIDDRDGDDHDGDDDDEKDGGGGARKVRLYFIGLLFFVLLFTVFCLILWGASKAYKPEISVKVRFFFFYLEKFTELNRCVSTESIKWLVFWRSYGTLNSW
jgi:hypothetical protein